MNKLSTLRNWAAAVLLFGALTMACKKSVTPAAAPAVEHRYPVIDRNGDTVAHFSIQTAANGKARLVMAPDTTVLRSAMGYEVVLYNGTLYTDIYAELNQMTMNPSSWTTAPVHSYSSGAELTTAEILFAKPHLKIVVPGEVVGIGEVE